VSQNLFLLDYNQPFLLSTLIGHLLFGNRGFFEGMLRFFYFSLQLMLFVVVFLGFATVNDLWWLIIRLLNMFLSDLLVKDLLILALLLAVSGVLFGGFVSVLLSLRGAVNG